MERIREGERRDGEDEGVRGDGEDEGGRGRGWRG